MKLLCSIGMSLKQYIVLYRIFEKILMNLLEVFLWHGVVISSKHFQWYLMEKKKTLLLHVSKPLIFGRVSKCFNLLKKCVLNRILPVLILQIGYWVLALEEVCLWITR